MLDLNTMAIAAFQYTFGAIRITYSHLCELALVGKAPASQPLISLVGLPFQVGSPGEQFVALQLEHIVWGCAAGPALVQLVG